MKIEELHLPMSNLPSQKYRAGTFQKSVAVKEAFNKALKKSGLSREVVAEELSRLLNRNISIHQINNWAAPEKRDRHIPLDCVGALAVILNSIEIIQAALDGSGYEVIGPEEKAYLELGKLVVEEKARRKKKRKLMEKLGI